MNLNDNLNLRLNKAMDSRVKSHFENLDDFAPIVIPENSPWLNHKPIFNFDLTQYKISETNSLLIQQQFAEIRSYHLNTSE